MARRQEILLIKDVLKLGNMGDLVRVSPGYARNYLFPYELAIPAGLAAKKQIEKLRTEASKVEVEREAKAKVLKKTMEGMSVHISARVAHDSELFGSIGTREIVAALSKSGIDLDNKQVHLNDKIKKLGRYTVEIRLHKLVGVDITVVVANSDPNAPSLDETLAAATTGTAPVSGAATAVAVAPAVVEAKPAATTTKKLESKVKNLGRAPQADDAKAKKS